MFTRKKAAMIVAEFLGTGILTLVILGVSKSTIGIPYFVALAAAVVAAAMMLVFGAVSGAHLNPAITIGMWSVRRIKTLPALVYIAAQLLGGAAAYLLYTYFVGQHWSNTGKFDNHVLVAEAVGGLIFGLGWAAAVYQKLSNAAFAASVALSLMLAIVVASVASGGLVNPAVALGMRSWVWGSFVLGPVLGSIIGFNLYALLFASEGSLIARKVSRAASIKDTVVEADVEEDDDVEEEAVPAPKPAKSSKKSGSKNKKRK